jgi:hypothetical protein
MRRSERATPQHSCRDGARVVVAPVGHARGRRGCALRPLTPCVVDQRTPCTTNMHAVLPHVPPHKSHAHTRVFSKLDALVCSCPTHAPFIQCMHARLGVSMVCDDGGGTRSGTSRNVANSSPRDLVFVCAFM